MAVESSPIGFSLLIDSPVCVPVLAASGGQRNTTVEEATSPARTFMIFLLSSTVWRVKLHLMLKLVRKKSHFLPLTMDRSTPGGTKHEPKKFHSCEMLRGAILFSQPFGKE